MTFSRRSSGLRLKLLPVAVLLMALLGAQSVSAHEHREVGEYEITIGFLNEPAILEEPNGLDLRVAHGHGDEGEPVEGLADTLRAEVSYGGESMPLELRAAFGEPGSYRADFIPTASGAYTFHITGNIEGMEVDETFTSGPDTFSEVGARDTLSFPDEVAAVGAVAADATDAADTADSAQMLSIVALIVGLLALVAGVAAIVLSRRGTAATEASPVAREPAV